jgi:hypothetical protein
MRVGALEHPNSVTLGASSESLAEGLGPFFGEVAHEYFHAWNLMRIRPAEYADVTYRTRRVARTVVQRGTLDVLLGPPASPRGSPCRYTDALRASRTLIARYLSSPWQRHFSAERVSEAEYGWRAGLP